MVCEKIAQKKKKFSFSPKTCLCVIWKKMSFAHLLQRKQEFSFFSLKRLCYSCLVHFASIANYTFLLRMELKTLQGRSYLYPQ